MKKGILVFIQPVLFKVHSEQLLQSAILSHCKQIQGPHWVLQAQNAVCYSLLMTCQPNSNVPDVPLEKEVDGKTLDDGIWNFW